MLFKDRQDAGQQLAKALGSYNGADSVVYALPRGGVIVGAEIARALGAPLDLIMARKVGHPQSPEYAIAAVDADGHIVRNPEEVDTVDPRWFSNKVDEERLEAERRRGLYLCGREPIRAQGKIAIIVDDGLATGLTMFAAIKRARAEHPRRVVVAVPVAPPDIIPQLQAVADDVVALSTPEPFHAIGLFYEDFRQITDDEVVQLMKNRPLTS